MPLNLNIKNNFFPKASIFERGSFVMFLKENISNISLIDKLIEILFYILLIFIWFRCKNCFRSHLSDYFFFSNLINLHWLATEKLTFKKFVVYSMIKKFIFLQLILSTMFCIAISSKQVFNKGRMFLDTAVSSAIDRWHLYKEKQVLDSLTAFQVSSCRHRSCLLKKYNKKIIWALYL